MAEATPSYVQVAQDGSGKKIRNIQVTRVIDGVEETLQIQVLALADEEGRPLLDEAEWRRAMLEQAIETKELLMRILAELT